jgi:hypothetical protein
MGKPKNPPMAAEAATKFMTLADSTDCLVLSASNDPTIPAVNTKGISGPSDSPDAIPSVESIMTGKKRA